MRIGSSASVLILMFLSTVVATPPASEDQKKKQKQKPPAEYSVVAGTVFREPGFALPNAEVILVPAPASGETAPAKGSKLTFTTYSRGEFAFRVPSQEGRYAVTASAKGYIRQQKTVEVHPAERVDVTFTLAAESNK